MKTFIVKASYPNGEEITLWKGESVNKVDAIRNTVLDNFLVVREFWSPSNLISCLPEDEIQRFHGYGSEELYDDVACWASDMRAGDVADLPDSILIPLFSELKIEEVDS